MSSVIEYRKEFENMILKGDLKEALKTLVPDSKEQIYLRFCEEFKKCYEEKKISKELDQIIEIAESKKLSGKLTTILKTRRDLLEYDLPSTTKERKEKIIDDLFDNYCGERLDYDAPFFVREKKSNNKDEEKEINNTPLILTEKMIEDEIKKNIEKRDIEYEIENAPINKRHKLFLEYIDKNKELNNYRKFDIPFYLMSKEEFTKVINFINNSKKDLSKYFNSSLTVEQIMRLLSEVNNPKFLAPEKFVSMLINNKYEKIIKKAKNRNDLKEVKKILWELYDICKKYNNRYVSGILLYILKLNKMENIYELKTLEEYLKFPFKDIESDEIYNINNIKTFNKRVNPINIPDINFYQISQHKFIEDLLIEFLYLNKAKKDNLNEFFKNDYIEKLNLIAELYKGEEISSEKYKEYLGDSEYDEIVKKTEMTICEYNPKEFKINEDIKIDIDFKNIKSINVSTYEINTENYYLETKAPLNSLFNIEGIIASNNMDIKIEGGENPFKRIRKTIELNQIEKGKPGIFLVEILGKGISSRIIIKRGRLNLITRNTSKGVLCQIINENNKIMKDDKTYLWYNNIKFTCEPKEGIFVLPYKVLVDPSNMYISP